MCKQLQIVPLNLSQTYAAETQYNKLKLKQRQRESGG